MGSIGIIANPASGKDVRRLVARASVFDNQEKQAIVRRVLMGIGGTLQAIAPCTAGADLGAGRIDASAVRIAWLNDSHGIVAMALDDAGAGLPHSPVTATRTASAMDTTSAARALRDLDCDVVLSLGGDGTNRAIALGWPTAPLIPISTGTNNVFPIFVEATIAGAAAALLASGRIDLAMVAPQHKRIHVRIDGERDDLALIDAVLTADRFVGSRALLAPEQLRLALLTRADPAAVGMTAIGGLLAPLAERDEGGLLLHLGAAPGAADAAPACTIHAPIAPGLYRSVAVRRWQHTAAGKPIQVRGPGVLAFDGERERTLKPGQLATLSIERDGPRVVDVARTLRLAAEGGCFRH
ncbi:MAG: NAD(+)/NADH kinase [Pseudomonadales bacterium]